jgi:hypothetical protein
LQTFHPLSILLKVDQHRQRHALHNISVKREVKVSLCMPWRYVHVHSTDTAPFLFNLGKWLASICHLLYPWGKSSQYSVWGWVGPSAGQDVLEKKKNFLLIPGIKPQLSRL